MNQRAVIVNADDLGFSRGTNLAILRAHTEGLVTSTSLAVSGPAADHAVEEVIRRSPRLGTGLHLVLTSGMAISPPTTVGHLVRPDGRFRHGFVGLARLLSGRHRDAALGQIRREFEAQWSRARSWGLRLDHLDSHRHVHMLPALWPTTVDLAARAHIPTVRRSVERPSWRTDGTTWLAGWVGTPAFKRLLLLACARRHRDASPNPVRVVFRGLVRSGCMFAPALRRALVQTEDAVVEIVSHPGLSMLTADEAAVLAPEDRRFLRSSKRIRELEALLSPDLRSDAARDGVPLMTFNQAMRMLEGPVRGPDRASPTAARPRT